MAQLQISSFQKGQNSNLDIFGSQKFHTIEFLGVKYWQNCQFQLFKMGKIQIWTFLIVKNSTKWNFLGCKKWANCQFQLFKMDKFQVWTILIVKNSKNWNLEAFKSVKIWSLYSFGTVYIYSVEIWVFCITQILREINFGIHRSAKSAIFSHLEFLIFYLY